MPSKLEADCATEIDSARKPDQGQSTCECWKATSMCEPNCGTNGCQRGLSTMRPVTPMPLRMVTLTMMGIAP